MTLCQETNRGSENTFENTGHPRERDIHVVRNYMDVNTLSIHLQTKKFFLKIIPVLQITI